MNYKHNIAHLSNFYFLNSISKRLENEQETLAKVLEKVLEDVAKVHLERHRKRAYMQEKRENVFEPILERVGHAQADYPILLGG